jgi:hypothetical protein
MGMPLFVEETDAQQAAMRRRDHLEKWRDTG